MLVLAGCAQSAVAPDINAAAARVLDRLGITLIEVGAGTCCGALAFHLEDAETARRAAQRIIDICLQHLAHGAEAMVMTASGCGVFVRDYARLLADDPEYGAKAQQVAAKVFDLSEVLYLKHASLAAQVKADGSCGKLAFHSPCTLQHGQQIRGLVEELLTTAGYQLTPVADGHLCCGSAGPYALLQPKLANELRQRKLATLGAGQPQAIATANIGCLMHLQSAATLPVRHWIECVDAVLADGEEPTADHAE
jgi:glycolate oxidase iron-sulfur subunit